MRHHTDSFNDYMVKDRAELIQNLKAIGEFCPDADDDAPTYELATRLYGHHHTRLLIISNDHADLLGKSYLMEVLQVVYDTAMFLTDDEFKEATGQS